MSELGAESCVNDLLYLCLSSILRLFHTIPGEGLHNSGQSREGSLSCHACCNTGPRFTASHHKNRAFGRPLHARDTEDLHEPRSQSDACMTDKLKYILS